MLDGRLANFIMALQNCRTYALGRRIVPPSIRSNRAGEEMPARSVDLMLVGIETCGAFCLDGCNLVVRTVARTVEIMRQYKVCDARCDFGAKTRSIEDAIMADARLQPMRFELVRKPAEQLMRGFSLADARNVVMFAFDCHERDPSDLR